MSYIPDCRVDENYNEKYLNDLSKEFINGFDFAVNCIKGLFLDNIDVYPELMNLLDDKKAIIQDGKVKILTDAIEHWSEMSRNEIITGLIDGMDDDEYVSNKKRVQDGY